MTVVEGIEYVPHRMKLERKAMTKSTYPKRHVEDFDFYSKSSGKSLNSFKKENDIVVSVFRRPYSGCIMEEDYTRTRR